MNHDNAMRSLVNAYIMCGGDPSNLFQPEQPTLPEGEVAFFKQYEDQMGNTNG